METAVVTGSQGFIGRSLVAELLKRGTIVRPLGRNYKETDCGTIYHLGCPSSNEFINAHPKEIMDIIMDGTRDAIQINPKALFINASSMGAGFVDLDTGAQNAYNIAKRCMEEYLKHSGINYINYRIPSVYGPGAHADSFIMRCVNGTATEPTNPNRLHYIAHVDDVVEAMLSRTEIITEELRLEYIYEQFTTGRRGLHRPTPSPHTVTD